MASSAWRWVLVMGAAVLVGSLLFAGLALSWGGEARITNTGCHASSHDHAGLAPTRVIERAVSDGERVEIERPAGKWYMEYRLEGARMALARGDGEVDPIGSQIQGATGGCNRRAATLAYLVEGNGTLLVRTWELGPWP